MFKQRRLLKQESHTVDEKYFNTVRPKLYELHSNHAQYGSRRGRSLAEHLDSACQFVLTVSKLAKVPDDKRSLILAATAVHDLNKLDPRERNVKTLARDRAFLKEQLERAGVADWVKTDDDLELVRRLIERHSGHNASDGMRFLPEDPNIKRWAAMLSGGDLYDLGIPEEQRIRKVENELTVALQKDTHLFKVGLSEDRGYLTALLLTACEEVLKKHDLQLLAIYPNCQVFLGEQFPDENVVAEIARIWQQKINSVFGDNIDQLVTDKSTNGIKVDQKAIEQDIEAVIDRIDSLLSKKYSNYSSGKVSQSAAKYQTKVDQKSLEIAESLDLLSVSNADEFAISEGLKAVYVSFRQIQPKPTPDQVWNSIAEFTGITQEQRQALEVFEPQYGRCLFAAKAAKNGMTGIQSALRESFRRRLNSSEKSNDNLPEALIKAVKDYLNLPFPQSNNFYQELQNYIHGNASQRSSIGAIRSSVQKLRAPQMPPETKVQMFSNRLAGGSNGDPTRSADFISALAYKLMKVGAFFPSLKKRSSAGKELPMHVNYLHFALPDGSSNEAKHSLRNWMEELSAIGEDGKGIKLDELKLYSGKDLIFMPDSCEGLSLPKRTDFIYSTITLPIVWGSTSSSFSLIKSLRLALEISLALDIGYPFVLSANLEIEPTWDVFGRVEGLPTTFQPFLGSGKYLREGHLLEQDRHQQVTAEAVLERLQLLGQLSIIVSSLQKKDDCLYDLVRAAKNPLSIYYVSLRWFLREKDESNLDFVLDETSPILSRLMEILMSDEEKKVSQYLREAAQVACEGKLWGNLRRRTGRAEPFSAFLKAIRSSRKPLDWKTVFASLTSQYHTRLDRIREHGVGNKKYEYVERYYEILYQLFSKEYQSKPERILSHRKDLEAAYLHFLREEYKLLKNQEEDLDVTED